MKVFVTGASSDIGLAVCRYYLDQDWSVLAHFRTPRADIEALASEHPEKFDLLQIDFSDTKNLESVLAECRHRFVACDVLINCAALLKPESFAKLTAENLLLHFSVNVVPGILLMRDMASEMMLRGWGRIVHLGSIGVKFGGGSGSFSYSLSKHSLEFLPSEAKVWASKGVLTNVLRIGVTDTRIHAVDGSKNMDDRVRKIPMQRMATVDEIAATIGFFGSDLNSFITGQIISVSGGE